MKPVAHEAYDVVPDALLEQLLVTAQHILGFTLHEYQKEAIRFLWQNHKSALFADVGLGKAVMSLTILARVLWELDSGQALVIAPIRVAKQTWPTEIREWQHGQWLDDYALIRAEDQDPEVKQVFDIYRQRFLNAATVMGIPTSVRGKLANAFALPYRERAKQDKREALARAKQPLHIIGLPQVEWLVNFHGRSWPYRTVVVDEASAFKDFQTKRWKALNLVFKKIDRMHLLTASPAAETWMDLWAVVGLLDRGERLGRKITHYREAHFSHDEYTRRYTLLPGHDAKIAAEIADICLVMKAEDYLPLDKPNVLPRYIELSDDILDLYDDFVSRSILSLPDAEIEAVHGGALINKLLQFTGGAVLDEERNLHEIHDDKLDDLRELIAELQGEPLMVGYWYQSTLKRLRRAFPKAVVMDRAGKCVDDWNAGKIDLLLIHPASAGHGLNMQKGPGHDLCFADLPWSRELYEQLIGRLARQGQKKVVRVHEQIVRRPRPPGYDMWGKRRKEDHMTADEIVKAALEAKGEGQAILFRYIRQLRDKAKAAVVHQTFTESEDDL